MPSTPGREASEKKLRARFDLQLGSFSLSIDLNLPGHGVTALFGRSGSGKTSSLRVIAGLERAARGFVAIGDEVWQDDSRKLFVPVHKRSLGYVFQEASLFPHRDVRGNLDYALSRVPDGRRSVSWDTAVELLGVGPLLDRRTQQLSGGERQRVAIARALLSSPEILLMDEPLAALDSTSKAAILPYLERLHDELAIPVLYVSHSIEEVARLADHIVMLEAGRVVAEGPLVEVLNRLDLPTAFADDTGSVIEATVAEHDEAYALTKLAFEGGALWVGHIDRSIGARMRARVLARDVSLALEAPQGSSILNVLPARVEEIRDDGPDKVNVRLSLDDAATSLLARITRRSRDVLALAPGQRVFAQVKSVALVA